MSTVVVKLQPASPVVVQTKTGPQGPPGAAGSAVLGQVITSPDWYINPSTGNDANAGTSIGGALKTWAGLLAKWGFGALLNPSGSTLTVHILGDMPSSDPITRAATIRLANAVSLNIVGTSAVGTSRTGSLTAVTAKNRSTNQPWDLTDGAIAWTGDVGKRVKLTSGASSGAYGYVLKDLGTHKARFSDVRTPPAIGALVPVTATPANGNTYAVQTLPQVYLSDVGLDGDWSSSSFPTINFVDLQFAGTGSFLYILPTTLVQFYGCIFTGQPQVTANAQCSFIQCAFLDGVFVQDGAYCGMFTCAGLPGGSDSEVNAFNAILQIDCDTTFQNVPVTAVNGLLQVGTAAGFDCAIQGPQSPRGGAFTIANTNTPQAGLALFAFDDGACALYGSGNVYGVDIGAGGKMTYAAGAGITITGSSGDFTLAGATTGRAWNEATGAYTASITNTWAHLVAAIGSGGFGGSAHALDTDAHILATSGASGGPAPGGFTPPTGTGPIKVVGGVLAGAAAPINPTVATDFTVGVNNTVLTSNGTIGVWATIVNANVAAGAAIAASKLAAPGATTQVIWNSAGAFAADGNFTYDGSGHGMLAVSLALGTSGTAAAGDLRHKNATTLMRFRNAAASGDRTVMSTDASDNLFIGNVFPSDSTSCPQIFICPSSFGYLRNGDTTIVRWSGSDVLISSGVPLELGGNSAASGALRMENAAIIAFRNAANSGDLNAVQIDGSDNAIFGNTTSNTASLRGSVKAGLYLGGLSDYAFLIDGGATSAKNKYPIIGYTTQSSPYGAHGESLTAGPGGGTLTLAASEYSATLVQVQNVLGTTGAGGGGNVDWPTPAAGSGYFKFCWNGTNGNLVHRKAGGGGNTFTQATNTVVALWVTSGGAWRLTANSAVTP